MTQSKLTRYYVFTRTTTEQLDQKTPPSEAKNHLVRKEQSITFVYQTLRRYFMGYYQYPAYLEGSRQHTKDEFHCLISFSSLFLARLDELKR